jgi:hypothetical protein
MATRVFRLAIVLAALSWYFVARAQETPKPEPPNAPEAGAVEAKPSPDTFENGGADATPKSAARETDESSFNNDQAERSQDNASEAPEWRRSSKDSRNESDTSVDALLERVLENNPQIKQAETAVALAEANLNEVRMRVSQEVMDIRSKLRTMEKVRMELDKRIANGTATSSDLLKVDTERAELEGRLHYSTGVSDFLIQRNPMASFGAIDTKPEPRPEPNDTMKSMLDAVIELTFENAPLTQVLTYLTDQYGVSVVVDPSMPIPEITLKISDVSLRNALQALTDQCDDLCFVFRDYGVFATTQGKAEGLKGAAIPEDTPYYAGGRRGIGKKLMRFQGGSWLPTQNDVNVIVESKPGQDKEITILRKSEAAGDRPRGGAVRKTTRTWSATESN